MSGLYSYFLEEHIKFLINFLVTPVKSKGIYSLVFEFAFHKFDFVPILSVVTNIVHIL